MTARSLFCGCLLGEVKVRWESGKIDFGFGNRFQRECAVGLSSVRVIRFTFAFRVLRESLPVPVRWPMQTKKTWPEPKRSADFKLEVARQAGQSCGGRSESKTHFCFPIWSVIFLVITLGKKLFPISERCAKDPLSCCLRWEETIYLVCIGNETWKILYLFLKAIRKCVLRWIIKYSMQFMYVSIRIFAYLWSWLRFLLFFHSIHFSKYWNR